MLLLTRDGSTPDHEYLRQLIQESISKGIKIASDAKERRNKVDIQVTTLKNNLENYYGISNIQSSVKLREYFMRVLSASELEVCTKKGKLSFDKENLEALAKLGRADANDIIRYRTLKKTLDSLDGMVNAAGRDGMVRPSISVAKTNRIHYLDPALMNIPKDILWDIIVSRREGGKLYSVDIKQQEPWILMHMLGIRELIDIISQENDFYNAVHKAVFKVDCPSEQVRDNIKTVWNAMSYGATLYGIKQYSKHVDGEAIYRYFENIKEYKEYKGKCYGRAKKNIQTATTYFGTEVYADAYGSKLSRALMDIPIQGTGADILALLVENLKRQLDEIGLSNKLEIYFTRHDEIIIDSDGTLDDDIVENILNNILTHQVDDWIPFRLEIETIK